jgi:hypothetical protein
MKIGGAFAKMGPNRLRHGAYPFVPLNTRPLGRGTDRREDEEVRLGEA